ncbi:hypothetical protein ES705_23168 [subsurface metagenome]
MGWNRIRAGNRILDRFCQVRSTRNAESDMNRELLLAPQSRDIIGSSTVQGTSSAAPQSRGHHRQLRSPGEIIGSSTVQGESSAAPQSRDITGSSAVQGHHRQLRSPGTSPAAPQSRDITGSSGNHRRIEQLRESPAAPQSRDITGSSGNHRRIEQLRESPATLKIFKSVKKGLAIF